MIVDCFTFFNELDMLECRLAYLDQHVDKFVLVEASITHSGKPKPYYFEENQSRYSKYLDKIIHVKLEIDPSEYDWNYDHRLGFKNASWQVENRQRNGILAGIKDLPQDAVIMVSDLDEIPNSAAIPRAVRLLAQKESVALETRQFYYNLSQCLIEPWPATVLTIANRTQRLSPQLMRDRKNSMLWVRDGGWHLTYFGSPETIRNKIMNFAHREYNNEQYTDLDYIESRVQQGAELYGRPFPMTRVDPNTFPEDFIKCFNQYLPEHSLAHYADSVEGFFSQEDFELYRKVVAHFPTGSHFVEVGSYKGRSSAFMAVEIAQSGKQIKFDCVDTWEGSEEHQYGQQFEDQDVVANKLFNVFEKNMLSVKAYYRPVKALSVEAAGLYDDESIDFVFIDAAHDYENVRADILAWAPKVKSSGIISGHDWHHPPIKQAVAETVGDVNTVGNCWYVFKG